MKANDNQNQQENKEATVPALAPITRDETRKGIRLHATTLGCDAKKAVSGLEVLLMFTMELERQAVLPPTYDRSRAVAIASFFDSNSSAMTKRLYEADGAAPVDRIAALAARLGGTPT